MFLQFESSVIIVSNAKNILNLSFCTRKEKRSIDRFMGFNCIFYSNLNILQFRLRIFADYYFLCEYNINFSFHFNQLHQESNMF